MSTLIPAAGQGDNGARTVALVGDFIQAQLAVHRSSWRAEHATPPPPLLVGVQGPQGCGASSASPSRLSQGAHEAPPADVRPPLLAAQVSRT